MSRYNFIFEEVEKNKSKVLMEIGTCYGRTAVKMIEASIKAGNKPSDIYYYGFDLFEEMTNEILVREAAKQPEKEYVVRELLERTGANIELFRGFSNITIPASLITNVIDLIFIDGGHSFTTVESDWNNLQRYISDKTIVIFDDYVTNLKKLGWGCNLIVDSLDSSWIIQKSTIFDRCMPKGIETDIRVAKVTRA